MLRGSSSITGRCYTPTSSSLERCNSIPQAVSNEAITRFQYSYKDRPGGRLCHYEKDSCSLQAIGRSDTLEFEDSSKRLDFQAQEPRKSALVAKIAGLSGRNALKKQCMTFAQSRQECWFCVLQRRGVHRRGTERTFAGASCGKCVAIDSVTD